MKTINVRFILFFLLIYSDSKSQILNEYAEIVIRRNEYLGRIGSSKKMEILINGEKQPSLKTNITRSILVPAGENTITCQIVKSSSMRIDTRPNQVYYLDVKSGGLFLDKPKFKLVRTAYKFLN